MDPALGNSENFDRHLLNAPPSPFSACLASSANFRNESDLIGDREVVSKKELDGKKRWRNLVDCADISDIAVENYTRRINVKNGLFSAAQADVG